MIALLLSIDPVSPKEGTENRPEDVPHFGRVVYRYDLIASTQDVARDWVDQGAPVGTVVTARAMTAGRGRRGRIWHTSAGASLSLTAVGPVVAPDIIWQIPLVVGMAVADALTEVVPQQRFSLRFPNDILLRGRKLGGILVETTKGKNGTDLLPLIGIGINLQRPPLPPEVAERAIALEDVGVQVTLTELETALFAHLTRRWKQWQTEGIEEALIAYHAYLDQQARRLFVIDAHPVLCRIVRIYANGAVMIETESGSQRAFHAAQVVLGDD